MKHPLYIGVDIGTTSTKCVVFDSSHKVHAVHYREYPLICADSESAEQNPNEILDAVFSAIKTCVNQVDTGGYYVELISFSSAMHGLISVDRSGRPLTNCITWADKRAAKWANDLKQDPSGIGAQIYKNTGTPLHAMAPLAKILWMKETHPDLFQATYKFIGIKEYLFFKLTDQYLIDYSIASATGLFNIHTLDWDETALQLCGITKEQLSTPVDGTHYCTNVSSALLTELNLSSATKFVLGASDGPLSNLGVGASHHGEVAITIGTSGAIRTLVDKPVTDETQRTFCYLLTKDKYCIGGPVNNGGIVLRWIRDELARSETEKAKSLGLDPYDMLTETAKLARPGADGLLFLPYLAGERAPIWDATATGSFIGLSLLHKKEHIIRSALEGVILNLYMVMGSVREMIGQPKNILATGGFARSPFWRQILSDVFNTTVTVPSDIESSCLGAVLLGRYAIGEIKNLDDIHIDMSENISHHPTPENVDLYQDLINVYTYYFNHQKETYTPIADYQKRWV